MEKTRIKDIFKTSSGCTPTSSNPAFYDSDDYRWLNSSEVAGRIYDTKKYISEKAFKKYTALKVYPKDTVVIAMYGATVGEIGILKVDSTTNQAVCAILPNYEIVNPDYFYYKMLNEKQNLIGLASGSARTNISQQIIADYETVIPIMAEQNKIADVLCAIDDLIEVNNKIIETSERLMREIYDYWFVQFDFPDGNGRPYKSSGGEMVYNETLKREIPKGWSVKRVDELCEVKTGKEDANFSVPDGDYKFFTCADEPLRCNTPCFSGKSIIIAGNGNFNVKHYDGNFNAYQRTYVLRPGDEFYGITFIEAKNKTELFTKGSNGSIVKFITKGDVGSIYVLTSPRAMELYETFNTILAEIDAVQSENEKLASLRDWLLPMLMNGQVKIKEK